MSDVNEVCEGWDLVTIDMLNDMYRKRPKHFIVYLRDTGDHPSMMYKACVTDTEAEAMLHVNSFQKQYWIEQIRVIDNDGIEFFRWMRDTYFNRTVRDDFIERNPSKKDET